VVTVRGQALKRVRDWRGRATSVLPPAQSASDVVAPGATPPPTSQVQGPASRSLLEADGLDADTWFMVDAHRILLNISRSLAGAGDFPTIQIIDPTKRTLVLPQDLDQAYSEIMTNGFHLMHRDEERLAEYIDSLAEVPESQPISPGTNQTLRLGPYPVTTFLPMFVKTPPVRAVAVSLGETGRQLILRQVIGGDNPPPVRWLASRAQVFLEDAYLDFAWSLFCRTQGSDLVCDLPTGEVQRVYREVHDRLKTVDGSSRAPYPVDQSVVQPYPAVSSLQLWVEQFDSDGSNDFFTQEPAQLGPFLTKLDGAAPSSEGEAGEQTAQPTLREDWRVVGRSETDLKLESCGIYSTEYSSTTRIGLGTTLSLLGDYYANSDGRAREIKVEQDGPNCVTLTGIPTSVLEAPQAILAAKDGRASVAPITLDTTQFRPDFGGPHLVRPPPTLPVSAEAKPAVSAKRAATPRWVVDIPVRRASCADKLDVSLESEVRAVWMRGDVPVPCQNQGATDLSAMTLRVYFTTAAAVFWSDAVNLVRGQTRVCRLPKLRGLMLPSTATVDPIDAAQFFIRGTNVQVLSSVTLSNSTVHQKVSVGAGPGAVLVTTPQPKSDSPSPSGGQGAPAAPGGRGAPAPNKPAPTQPSKPLDAPKALAAGTYIITVQIKETDDEATADNRKMPRELDIDLTDTAGKPLVFVVPNPPKTDPSGNAASTTNKVSPCCALVATCPCKAGGS
jgi:hypothetical protein